MHHVLHSKITIYQILDSPRPPSIWQRQLPDREQKTAHSRVIYNHRVLSVMCLDPLRRPREHRRERRIDSRKVAKWPDGQIRISSCARLKNSTPGAPPRAEISHTSAGGGRTSLGNKLHFLYVVRAVITQLLAGSRIKSQLGAGLKIAKN